LCCGRSVLRGCLRKGSAAGRWGTGLGSSVIGGLRARPVRKESGGDRFEGIVAEFAEAVVAALEDPARDRAARLPPIRSPVCR
jgi:hypothetical protein